MVNVNRSEAKNVKAPVKEPLYRANVLVCGGTGCTSSDSALVLQALQAEIAKRGLDKEVRLVQTGCRGFCSMGPGGDDLPGGHPLLPGAGHRRAPTGGRDPAQGARGQAAQLPGAAGAQGPALLQRHSVLRQADPHRPAQLRHDRPGEHRRVHRPRRLPGPGQGPHHHDARRRHPGDEGLRPPRPRRRRLPHRPQVGALPAIARAAPSTSSATPTRATPAPSWTARSWRAIPTPCWKA